MNEARNLIRRLPDLCKCRDADRFSVRNTYIFDTEFDTQVSNFSYRETDQDGERLAVLEIPEMYIGDYNLYQAGMCRLKIQMLSGDRIKKRITATRESILKELTDYVLMGLKEKVPAELEIESVLPLEVALLGVWS